jgi:hypothetical protein
LDLSRLLSSNAQYELLIIKLKIDNYRQKSRLQSGKATDANKPVYTRLVAFPSSKIGGFTYLFSSKSNQTAANHGFT